MKRTVLMIALLYSVTFFTSCTDKKDEKPTIDIHELGYENSKKVKAGEELHIDAEVVANNKIDKIRIEIHHDGDDHKSKLLFLNNDEWAFDSTYTEYAGLKNAEFHKHIKVPAHAEAGHYHFQFSVSDQEGNLTIIDDEIEVTQ
jgi:hypothetical protein